MSYDYILIKGIPGTSLEMLAEAAMSEPIGAVADIKSKISDAFPSVQWQESVSITGLDSEVALGHGGPPEFQLTVEPDGMVYIITMSRAEKSEVELIASNFGLVLIDEQSMDFFGG
jgi:hypothetical protein